MNDIISQYVAFTKVYNEQMKLHGRSRETVTETIHICKDRNVLHDGAVKMFLNASSKQDDVSKELKAFLDYVAGVESEDEFVQRVARAVQEGTVSVMRKYHIPDEEIVQEIQEEYNLTRKEAEEYL